MPDRRLSHDYDCVRGTQEAVTQEDRAQEANLSLGQGVQFVRLSCKGKGNPLWCVAHIQNSKHGFLLFWGGGVNLLVH